MFLLRKKTFGIIGLVVFSAIALYLILAGQDTTPKERLEPLNLDSLYHFSLYENLDAYLIAYRNKIAEIRPNLSDKNLQTLTPLSFQPQKTARCNGIEHPAALPAVLPAVLMVHGFTDSPFSFSDIAQQLKTLCYPFYHVILPGHGLTPGALLDISYQDWQNAVHFALEDIQKTHDDVIMIGYSTGAILAFNAALTAQRPPKRLILTNPVFSTYSARRTAFLLYPLSWLGHIFPSVRWSSIGQDQGFYKYDSIPFKGALQIHKAIKTNQKLLRHNSLDGEILLIFTEQDQTVYADASFNFAKNHLKKKDSVLIYNDGPKRPQLEAHTIRLDAKDDVLRVIGASHLSLFISPENNYWGKNPQAVECGHYKKNNEKFQKCQNGPYDFNGEKTEENLEKVDILRRATFNPRFFEQWIYIKNFLETGKTNK